MSVAVHYPEAPISLRTDLGAIFTSLEIYRRNGWSPRCCRVAAKRSPSIGWRPATPSAC